MTIQLGEARLTRADMLRNTSDFVHVRRTGTRFVGKFVVTNVASALDNRTRIGVIASRKFNRHAVVRNGAKRVMKESFRRLKGGFDTPIWIVMIARRYIKQAHIESVQKELIGFLIEAKVFAYYRFPNQ